MSALREIAFAGLSRCDEARTVEEAGEAFLDAAAAIGFRYANVFTHGDPLAPAADAVSFLSVPEGWLERFSAQGYIEICPVLRRAEESLASFSWDDENFRAGLAPAQQRVLDEMGAFGLKHGFTKPIITTGAAKVSCHLITDGPALTRDAYAAANAVAVMAYDRAHALIAQPAGACGAGLTARERDCLLWAARGKSDWAIGELLHISERTVHHTIERAKSKFDVATRVQAIMKAIRLGAFTAEEALLER